MHPELADLFNRQRGVATTAQIISIVGRRQLSTLLDCTALERIWHGVYSYGPASDERRVRGLDLACGEPVALCLGTAAGVYGFDTETNTALHVLNPLGGHHLRSTEGLVVHRREGAPLTLVSGRPATTAAWTAVEVARSLPRGRALATLDAALRSRHCETKTLTSAVSAQSGRRGIIKVRLLLPLANGKAESPMESEARLVMIDGGLPTPTLQYEVIDSRGKLRRLDFAWPEYLVAAEYDSDQWHSGADALQRDREKWAALQDLGWTVIPIVVNDVRHRKQQLVDRIDRHLIRARAA